LHFQLLREYELIWSGSDDEMGVKTLLINKPDAPVLIDLRLRRE